LDDFLNMTMRLFITLILGLGLGFSSLYAQNAPDFWRAVSPDEVVLPENAESQQHPVIYQGFKLDFTQMAAYMNQAPREFSTAAGQKKFHIVLPLANGSRETFAVVKTRVIDAALEALHPEIGTYAGVAMNHPGMQVRITITPSWGFRAMIMRADKGVEYVEPLAEWQNKYYMAYDRTDLPTDPRHEQAQFCQAVHPQIAEQVQEQPSPRFSPGEGTPGEGEKLLGGPVNLKVYRLACAATGEFSQDNGGNKDAVFQKITTVINQLNGMVERDINIRLILIPESFNVIFLDPATDPYTGSGVGTWIDENPAVLNQNLPGFGLYDIGHVFGRYQGGSTIGIAQLSSCCSFGKGRGASSDNIPYGDYFMGIVAHEMGHQWSAGHTFNQCNPGDGFSYESACEPGGGNTIMGYNSCGAGNNTTGGRDLFYHACSMTQIRQFVEMEGGSTCGTSLATTNNAPMASTPYPALTHIPINTPFQLTGSAIDPDGDQMTYCWDQIDLGPTSPLGTPALSAPTFRFFEPTTEPTRTFPRIQTVISNSNSKTEVLPAYARDLNFAFVVRDNQPNGGGIATATVKLRANAQAGPFLVTYPNEGSPSWNVGEYQTILWDVANTDKAPINSKKVNIKLSVNNGLDYPITLATGVPNIGRYCILVPNQVGSNNRIRIEAADNVFFDISNAQFPIVQGTNPSVSMCAASLVDFACLPGVYTNQISTFATAGFSNPITLSATGLPNGATATFSPNPVQPGSSATMTISFPSNAPEGTFDVTVSGVAGAINLSSLVTLKVVNNNLAAFAPLSPANGAAGVNLNPLLVWNGVPDADLYDIELATNPSFDASVLVVSGQNIVAGNFQVSIALQEGAVYYWRVRAKNDCGVYAWSDAQVFVVAVQTCNSFEATDLPKNISANTTPTVESKITLTSGGAISDLNIKKIQGTHTFFKDLEAHLIGPSGTDVLLWKDKCPQSANFNFGIDDGAAGTFNCPPPNNGSVYKPSASLNAFIGQPAAGVWTLRVKDNMISSGGTLLGFELEICSGVALNPPLIVKNDALALAPGSNASIGDNLLKAEDTDNGPSELVFTMMTLPKNGQLLVNGGVAVAGTQFTQTDISNGSLRYYDFGLNVGSDKFNFSVTDNNGGLEKGTYMIQPFAVNTHEPNGAFSFDLAPNPAGSVAVLSLTQSLSSEARVTLLNLAGQVVGNWQLAAGAYSLRMELGNLPKGVYAVSMENEQLKSVKKLILQ